MSEPRSFEPSFDQAISDGHSTAVSIYSGTRFFEELDPPSIVRIRPPGA
jgi:hypothetical protein